MMRGETEGRKSGRQATAATDKNGADEVSAAAAGTPAVRRKTDATAANSVARRKSVRSVKRTATLRRTGGAGATVNGGVVNVGSLRKRSSLRDAVSSANKAIRGGIFELLMIPPPPPPGWYI
jgi:hypothetical protein